MSDPYRLLQNLYGSDNIKTNIIEKSVIDMNGNFPPHMNNTIRNSYLEIY